MREVKFRQWDSRRKIMHLGIGATNPSGFVGFPCVSWEKSPVMQYTGLLDKSGKEIYEGDIIKEGGFISTIEWATPNARFCYKTITGTVGLYAFYGEIIGNIYENPELLA